ncbi:MAG TPA: PhzF family phenazine biosynthesis protein [Bacillota bacterium]|nr:PhzF family phenazine biosynthesis protein [Bacillota bacterium]
MMRKLYKLTAFPKTVSGGNKAGVYFEADNLSEKEMQSIAKEVGFSETAFVMRSNSADFKVRFFTPTSEVDLCGHATMATFNLLRDLGVIKIGLYTQETKAGILSLDVREDIILMQQPKPIFSEVLSYEEVATCFSNLEINENLPIQVVSTGIREIFLPVKNLEILNKLNPDFDKMTELSNRYNTIGIHAFALVEEVDAYGRNFAPVVGINEESATGTSNGALASYLYTHFVKKDNFILRQGYSMNQPSEIVVKLEIKEKEIHKVHVGGSARIISE